MAGRTIREAIGVALEGLSGDLLEWVCLAKQKDAMRKHVIRFVHDYARNRGVILSNRDIIDELDKVVAELKSGRPLSEAAHAQPVREHVRSRSRVRGGELEDETVLQLGLVVTERTSKRRRGGSW